MKAAVYEGFQSEISVQSVPDPEPSDAGIVLKTGACGICRSDWHGWMGNDPDIVLPHVPGHELAGTVAETGKDVKNWSVGDRVTVPFVGGCGNCPQCQTGNQQICDNQFQPGFTAWGGFAEYVALDYADENLVRLPDELDFVTSASLGCRFITSYRAVVDQGRVEPENWVAVFGCGGVGLSAIMIARAFGAEVIAVDIDDSKLELAQKMGASLMVNSRSSDPVEAIRDVSKGGAHISIDAIGNPRACFDSIASLRKRGRHIQVGLMEIGGHSVPIPIDQVIARELEIYGSHGMQAHRYPEMLEMISAGKLDPANLVGNKVSLQESVDVLAKMDEFGESGISIIDSF